ncbi:recombination protein RecT [Anaeroarcus burkinensis]|uniref:recombination protein RecT n=1 Tax=Anaeroarcus burkinensis TaxID=82376 RepID=UPI0003FB63EF|nr:recombination protein RecT [Anaeroarcus burkinensis]
MAAASGNNNALVERVAANKQQTQAMTPAQTVQDYLRRMGPEIAKALPKHMDADRMARIALTTIRTTPKLLECRIESLMAGIMQAAQLGLEPGQLGHCYLIPYGNQATFIIGYKGMIDLARRSGNIKSIYTHCVYQNDEFSYQYGLNQDLHHVPAEEERGSFKGAYAVAHFVDGGYQFEYMTAAEIEKRRNRSKAANSGPWVTDFEEMAMKTVLRHMWKFLPISVEVLSKVEQADETAKSQIAEDMGEVPAIDVFAHEPEKPMTDDEILDAAVGVK